VQAEDEKSFMWPMGLPNVYADCRICFNNVHVAARDLGGFIDGTINAFWTSDFNNHLDLRFPGRYRNFKDWEKAAKDAPNSWTTWDWAGMGHKVTLKDIMDKMPAWDAPIQVQGMIPEVKMPMTFEQITEWMGTMTTEQKARILASANAGQYILRANRGV